jgi:hypothetical protein
MINNEEKRFNIISTVIFSIWLLGLLIIIKPILYKIIFLILVIPIFTISLGWIFKIYKFLYNHLIKD